MRPMSFVVIAAVAFLALARPSAEAPAPVVEARPHVVHIERRDHAQALNFDFLVTNLSDEAWLLHEIEVSVYDAKGRLQARQTLNDNGNSPGIATVNQRQIAAGERILVFNPFHTFDDELELSALSFRFVWRRGGGDQASTGEVRVLPVDYAPRVLLRLPLGRRSLVWDGHDYYSHHRRFNYLSANAVAAGTQTNPDRYGLDLVPVNDAGDMHSGTPASNESWYGFGTPVYAAAPGTVVASFDAGLDNRDVDEARLKSDALADYGNYLVIDHGGGEFALYGHLRHASARVRRGDVVARGQHIAAVGASGSSLMPHLHFQLQTRPGTDGDGLPAYFTDIVRVLGARVVPVIRGPIDSGDIVEPASARR
ncbi:MAG: M23 family metallopeptidase [Acidobacteria bacterium]|nr:M23 family metallopeptidase [Acidobacteriota bacterium]